MPKSKTHYKRKMKLRKRHEKFESLIKKRVKAFNELPEEDKVALLTRWQRFSNKALRSGKAKEETAELGGVTTPVEEEEDGTSR